MERGEARPDMRVPIVNMGRGGNSVRALGWPPRPKAESLCSQSLASGIAAF